MAEERNVEWSTLTSKSSSHEAINSHGAVTFSIEVLLEEEPRHLLDACFLCQKPLHISSDVFMYLGNTPFCSEDCRQEQIYFDDAGDWEPSHCRRIPRRRASLLAVSSSPQPKAAVAR